MFNKLQIVWTAALSIASLVANANSIPMAANPSTWRLENYVGGGNAVVVWYTNSTCANGNLSLGNNNTAEDRNRFYATVMEAKATNRSMFVYYDNASAPGSCLIISFGIDVGQ